MASLKISQMPLASEVKNSDYVPIIQDGENKRVSAKLLGGSSYTAGSGILIDPTTNTISTNLHLCKIVSELPDKGELDKIYLTKSNSSDAGNIYNEYLYVDDSWELIGNLNTGIDLSEYSTTTYVNDTADTICSTIGASLGNNVTDGVDTGSVQTILLKHRTNSVHNSDFNTTIGTSAGQEVSFNSTHYISNGNIKNALESLDGNLYLKADISSIPIKVSLLTNDVNYATTDYVDTIVGDIPTTDNSNIYIYHNSNAEMGYGGDIELVPDLQLASPNDISDIYFITNKYNYTDELGFVEDTGTKLIKAFISDRGKSDILASAALTGIPTAPTASSSTNTTQIATTLFVLSVVSSAVPTKTSDLINDSDFVTSSVVNKLSVYDTYNKKNYTISGRTLTLANSGNDGQVSFYVDSAGNPYLVHGQVIGLGTAAYTDSTAYATTAQGALADTAVLEADFNKTLGATAGSTLTAGDTTGSVQDCLATLNTKIDDIDTGVNSISLGSADLGEDVKLLDSNIYKFDAGQDSLAELSGGDVYFGSVGVFDDTDDSNHKHLIGKVVGLGTAAFTESSDYATTSNLDAKQDKLISGLTIKTINGNSLLGEGDITISGSDDIDLSDYLTKVSAETTYVKKTDIPTKVSELENDSKFITLNEVPQTDLSEYAKTADVANTYQVKGDYTLKSEVPTKVSDLANDSGFITADDIPTVDLSEYAKSKDIPTKISQLDNDDGYITTADLPVIPTKTSDITNDSDFVTSTYVLEQIANAISTTLNTEV